MGKIEKILQYGWFYAMGVVLLCFIIAWSLLSPKITSSTDKLEYTYLHKNWSQVINGEVLPLDNIKNFQSVEKGEKLIFTCKLPEIKEKEILLFYTEHQEVVCEVDGQVIQSFEMNYGYEILKTPGAAWNQVDLTEDMGGKPLTLSLYSPINSYNNDVPDIYFIKSTDVNMLRLEKIGVSIIIAVVLLVVIIIFAANAWLWKNPKRKKYFFAVSQFYGFILIILLAKLGFFDLFFARPILSFLIEHLFLRFLPIAIWRLAVNSTDRFRFPKMLLFLKITASLDITVCFILQFAFGISLLETMWINNLVVAVTMVIMVITVIRRFKIFKILSPEEYPFLALGLIFFGGICDIIKTLLTSHVIIYGGIFSVVANVLYIIVIYTLFIKQDSRIEQEKIKFENSYNRLKTTSLNKQINVHFIFNALNGVSALCKTDPKKADEAIVTFSAYLRSYINLIDDEDNIYIMDEIDIVENYLLIEQMRFGNKITYSLDILYEDFFLPPFTIQVLVENAVVHGILENNQPGHVKISTKKVGDFAQITVEDDGKGFDMAKAFREKAVGLRNVKNRVEIMLGGTLAIDSKVGHGTKVIVTIPIIDEDFPDGNLIEI